MIFHIPAKYDNPSSFPLENEIEVDVGNVGSFYRKRRWKISSLGVDAKGMLSNLIIASSGNKLLCTLLAELLGKEGAFESITICESIEEAFKQSELNSLVIIFNNFPISSLSNQLGKYGNDSRKTIVVLDPSNKLAIYALFKLPIDGLISLDSTYDEIKAAIHLISFKRLKYVSPHLVGAIRSASLRGQAFSHLSRKELDVALLIMNGARNKEIAKELNLSPKTVSTYKFRIFKKLDISAGVQLLQYASSFDSESIRLDIS